MLKVQDIKLSLLKPWEDNPRINDEAVDAVVKSIESFGFNVPILCDQQFTIITGHTRWKAAKKVGMISVPAIVLEITEAQRKAFAVADNKTSELAKWDYVKLRKVLEELKRKKINLPSLGYSQAELMALQLICHLLAILKLNSWLCLHSKKSLIGRHLRSDSKRNLLKHTCFCPLKFGWKRRKPSIEQLNDALINTG
jgi:ParB/RepB/Spo0J family partition protein